MSEQIREQVSAFLDGELPDSETELLLKRLTRDGELRESFGRYALIGEAVRGSSADILTKGFASRVNLAIDGEPVQTQAQGQSAHTSRWWRPLAGVAVAAGVATVAIVALQQRSLITGARLTSPVPITASVQNAGAAHEPLSYTVPTMSTQGPAMTAPARLANYVFAHSKYSSGLSQRAMLADMLIEVDDQPQTPPAPRVQPVPTPEAHVAP
jgi:sigma-E factor negative regulatory protein RseA